VPAGAVAALYIAAGCNGQVHPAVLVMIASKTGVTLDIFF
jgi:hypothetical protein